MPLIEYNYDKASEVLQLFKNNKIASLTVKKVEKDEHSTFVFDYMLFDDLTEKQANAARKLYMDSFPQRVKAIGLLNSFIEAQVTNNVNDFSFQYSVVAVSKCIFAYSYDYNNATNGTSPEKQFVNTIEQLGLLVTKMGIGTSMMDSLYTKDGVKGKKYKRCSIDEVIKQLKTIVE